ncbi:conjugal transfer protein TraB [Streptomyces sp. NPDC001904]|uniref:conjugal transfer protein TraB n=1 Tax=Streptomyces sp. NPDC001904 TaxID=3154531 RepID=UPI003329D0C1
MSDLTPAASPAAAGTNLAPTDSDNRYKAVQHKLTALATSLDGAAERLHRLQRKMHTDAQTSEGLARDIDHAEVDKKFVEIQNAVSTALGGAAIDARHLATTVADTSADAWEAKTTHARLYEALDHVRSGRAERTPRPGFFENRGG